MKEEVSLDISAVDEAYGEYFEKVETSKPLEKETLSGKRMKKCYDDESDTDVDKFFDIDDDEVDTDRSEAYEEAVRKLTTNTEEPTKETRDEPIKKDETILEKNINDINIDELFDGIIEETSSDIEVKEDEETTSVFNKIDLTKILIIIGSIVLIIVLLIFLFKPREQKQEVIPMQEQPRQAVIPAEFKNLSLVTLKDNLMVNEQIYSDYLIVEKKTMTWGTMVIPLICGTTTKNKIEVKIPVSVEEYNLHKNGEILEIFIQKISINNKEYLTNPTIGNVIGE